jgi:hypothetical protein
LRAGDLVVGKWYVGTYARKPYLTSNFSSCTFKQGDGTGIRVAGYSDSIVVRNGDPVLLREWHGGIVNWALLPPDVVTLTISEVLQGFDASGVLVLEAKDTKFFMYKSRKGTYRRV